MNWKATNIPEGKCCTARVTKHRVTMEDFQNQIMSFQHHPVGPGVLITRLIVGDKLMMVDTEWERQIARDFINAARGDVLIFGLGLGCTVREIVDKPSVKSVSVIEKNPDVIELVEPHMRNAKLTVVHGDAFSYEPEQTYDAIWIDIWHSSLPQFTGERRALAARYRRFKKQGGFLRTWRLTHYNG